MFDKEIVKEEIKSRIPKENWDNYDFNQIVNGYTIKDGFYYFRIDNLALVFDENKLIDACPGYYSI